MKKTILQKLGIALATCACISICGEEYIICHGATAYVQNWDLVDSGKHLDVDGDSKYMSYIWKAKKTWNKYKSGVVREDSWKVVEDVYVTDVYKVQGSVGTTYSNGKIELNKYYMEDYSSDKKKNAATHEMGHALGLDHSVKKNVMYYASSTCTSLGSCDKASYDEAYKNY